MEQVEPELRFPGNDPGDGLQAAVERSKALEADPGASKAETDYGQRHVPRGPLDRAVRQGHHLTGHTQNLKISQRMLSTIPWHG